MVPHLEAEVLILIGFQKKAFCFSFKPVNQITPESELSSVVIRNRFKVFSWLDLELLGLAKAISLC